MEQELRQDTSLVHQAEWGTARVHFGLRGCKYHYLSICLLFWQIFLHIVYWIFRLKKMKSFTVCKRMKRRATRSLCALSSSAARKDSSRGCGSWSSRRGRTRSRRKWSASSTTWAKSQKRAVIRRWSQRCPLWTRISTSVTSRSCLAANGTNLWPMRTFRS